jgi:ribosome-associated toxin RatA of RatAB toxin-antitoxin module
MLRKNYFGDTRLTINQISVLYSTPALSRRKSLPVQKGRKHLKIGVLAGAVAVSQLLSLALLVQPFVVPYQADAKESISRESMENPSISEVTEEVINGKAFSVSKIIVHARPEQVFRVLTDYVNAPKVFPQLKKCQVVEDHGATKILHHKVAPSGLPGTYEYQLEVKELAPRSLEWHRISGDFKAVDGFWKLDPIDGGFTQVTYSTYVNGGMFIPQMLIKHQFRVDMPNVMAHLKSESEGNVKIAHKPGGPIPQ